MTDFFHIPTTVNGNLAIAKTLKLWKEDIPQTQTTFLKLQKSMEF